MNLQFSNRMLQQQRRICARDQQPVTWNQIICRKIVLKLEKTKKTYVRISILRPLSKRGLEIISCHKNNESELFKVNYKTFIWKKSYLNNWLSTYLLYNLLMLVRTVFIVILETIFFFFFLIVSSNFIWVFIESEQQLCRANLKFARVYLELESTFPKPNSKLMSRTW